jgi:hypothetical protein
MSYSTYFNPIQKNAYSFIGGEQNNSETPQYTQNQTNILQQQHQKEMGTVPKYVNRPSHSNLIGNLRYGVVLNDEQKEIPNTSYQQFNPYYDFLEKKGLFKENGKQRIVSKPFTINSSVRNTAPTVTISNEINLQNDPLSFATANISIGINDSKQNILTIAVPNHSIKVNDRITLSGIQKPNVSIKNIYTDINSDIQRAVVFILGSTSAVFYCNFDTLISGTETYDTSMSFDPSFKIGSGLSFGELQAYDTSDMFVTISGFDISHTGTPYIGNIPINFLNSTHRIYFTNPDYVLRNKIPVYTPDTLINIPDSNKKIKKITGFYISLPTPFSGFNSTNSMTINLQFNFIGGIPINKINAQFPIDENNLNGYHRVYNVTRDTISILLDKNTHYREALGYGLTEQQISFGGNGIYLATINNLSSGYSNPNYYKAELPYMMHDVVMVKLLSISFPNSSKVFTNTEGIKNTRIYWQNQDDGDFIYNIEIEPGNYSPSELSKLIHDKFYEVKKKYSKIGNTSTSYTDRNFMTVSIDTNTNRVTINGYKEASLIKPIQDISPEIAAVGDGNPPYTLTISQDAHGLLPGDSVVFTGFVATSGIPTDTLNATHTVVAVPTSDTYTIVIDNFNLLSGTRADTGGGYAAKAHVPSAFKLLFNYPDTMGKQLGFRKVGQNVAVTKFSTSITNFDEYQDETVIVDGSGSKFVYDESGNTINLTSNSLKLSGYDYALMVIRNFDNMINISENKQVLTYFAKINLSGLPGKLIYDTFVSPPLVFYEPIDMSSLIVSFYTPDGLLFDFNGVDHSFDIEVTSIEYVPEETGIITTRYAF